MQKQHFIPQFFLKRWRNVDANNRIGSILINKRNYPFSFISPKNTAYENGIWSFSEECILGIERDGVENHYYSKIDNKAAELFLIIDKNGLPSLNGQQKHYLFEFMCSLVSRYPENVKWLKKFTETEFRNSLKSNPDTSKYTDESFEDIVEQHYPGLLSNYGIFMLPELSFLPQIGKRMHEFSWHIVNFLLISKQIILSDRPIIIVPNIKSQDCIISLPISPHQVLIGTSGSVRSKIENINLAELADRINYESVRTARTRIYCIDESLHDYVVKQRKRLKIYQNYCRLVKESQLFTTSFPYTHIYCQKI